MKKLVVVFWLGASLIGASGQGLINFANSPSTLVSWFVNGYMHPIDGAPGSCYFALLTSPVGANTFTFAGVYATNQAVAGLLNGGSGVEVNGWAPGTARDFLVVGWSAADSLIYNPAWVQKDGSIIGDSGVNLPTIFGGSDIGTGVAGGITSSGTQPNLNIFGGATGIQSGFAIYAIIPEPSSFALVGLGVASLLIFRRNSKPFLRPLAHRCHTAVARLE